MGIDDITPVSTPDMEGTVKTGTNRLRIAEIRKVTGTTGATNNYVSFSYPSGYTNTNTRVLSLEVNYNSTSWIGPGAINDDGSQVAFFYNLASSAIIIYYPDITYFKGKPFRMVLMKVQ